MFMTTITQTAQIADGVGEIAGVVTVEVAAGVVISFNEGSEKQKPSPKGGQERILFVLI